MSVFTQKKVPESTVPGPTLSDGQSSLVGKTLMIKGEIYSEDEILIEGKVQGRITVKNRVVIGRNGDVEAEIEARDVVIHGKVKGNVRGSQKVEIVPSGSLHGDIHAPRVVIADSGIFEGNIEMRPKGEKPRSADEKTAGANAQGGEAAGHTKPTHK
ncbi:MAG: polymer-forming cytoskeletal protein [Candidatus Aminicenantes bacterium]|nr:polymer-forming cytoskeletal protein [Candidatus Aminicenantes bacterium]